MNLPLQHKGRAHALAKPPSVLFVLPWNPDSLGGVNTCVINLYRKLFALTGHRALLIQNEYPIRMITTTQSQSLGEVHQFYVPAPFDAQASTKSILSYLVNLPLFALRFTRFLKRENVQVVNLHFPGPSAATILIVRALLRHPYRVVLSFHGADVPPVLEGRGLQASLWRFIFRRSDAVVGCSRYLADLLLTPYPMLGGKIHAIHNGVDIAACASAVHTAKLPPELDGLFYIAMVARFEEKKAHEVILESFRAVLEQFPGLRLVLVGTTGPTLAAIRRSADGAALRDRVLIYTDMPHETTLAVIAKAAVLVLPSRAEPFGIVTIEAGALGTPVIASNVGGVPEIIEDGRTGVLVPSGDAAALAAAIRTLLANQSTARDSATKFKAVVAANFTWDRALLAYRDIFFGPPHR